MVLFGKTGSGKSASGNTILGRKAFISKKSSSSVTQDVEVQNGTIGKLPVAVYDTPGFFDTELSEKEIREKCQSVFSKCESGPCVFLLVIRADRYTAEEKRAVEKIENLLGEKRLENTWILFTRGDELEEENMTIKEFLKETPALKKLVEKYKNRYHVFNNKTKKMTTEQVIRFILKINNTTNKFGTLLKRKTQSVPANSNRGSVPDRRLVLLGKTGVGKSATGNTILGQKCFKSAMSSNAVTKHSEIQSSNVDGRNVSVVDTPGFFDPNMPLDKLIEELGKSVYLSSPGPHAFFLVLKATDRFTDQELRLIDLIEMIFGQEASKYTVVLFTNGDQLGETRIEKLIEENSSLRELVQRCGGSYHVFNNKDLSNRQVTELMMKIDRMVEENGGSCYSNEMFEEALRCRQEEEVQKNREEEEKREEEKQNQEEMERVRKETERKVREERKEASTSGGGSSSNTGGGGLISFLRDLFSKW